MKRKKWSESEEQTLLNKYSELLNSGILAKLKTREKKFKPIADHVIAMHHLRDSTTYPFKWSWRDVSIKIQNMRHQYLGVKQKIKVSDFEFNWKDGENHWENFLKYKEVFGDVELELKHDNKKVTNGCDDFFEGGNRGGFGVNGNDRNLLGFDIDSEDLEEGEGEEAGKDEGEDGSCGEFSSERKENEDEGERVNRATRMKKRKLEVVCAQVLKLRDAMVRKEERMREGEFVMEESLMKKDEGRRAKEIMREERRRDAEERLVTREMDLEEMQIIWARKKDNRVSRLARELDEERRWRMKMQEKWEEEEMEWRERMVAMQVEHEKQMMQMQADAFQSQMQILGVMSRLVCQFFGSSSDGLGGGLGALPPHVMQNLQHPGGLEDNGKPDPNSPSEFI